MKSSLLLCLSVCLLASNVSGQSIQPTNQTLVFDSAGRSLGPVVPLGNGDGAVRMRIGTGESVLLGVYYYTSVFEPPSWKKTAMVYTTSDCTGQIYSVDNSLGYAGIRHAMVTEDNRLFLGATGVNSVYIVIASIGTSTGGCNTFNGAGNYAYAVTEYMDLDTVFTPPFHIGGGPAEPSSPSYSDVPADHPFFQSIELIRAAGVTAGCGGGQFCPDSVVTRAQMAAFLAQALGLRFLP